VSRPTLLSPPIVILALILAVELPTTASAAGSTVATFDDNNLLPNSFWNGSDGSGQFFSSGVKFTNSYTDFGGGYYGWSGWSYSNGTNTTDSAVGYDNSSDPPTVVFYADRQYNAITGSGVNGSANYAVGYESFYPGPTPCVITLPQATSLKGVYLTNTTYAYLSMSNGDALGGKKFGGPSGTDPDWFKLTITGSDSSGQATGSVDFYLSDFRSANKYIVNNWTWQDLASLGTNVRTLGFTLASSDTGSFGFYTPSYFAIDDFTFAGPLTWSGTAGGAWSQAANWGGTALTGSQAIAFSGSNQVTSVNDLQPGTQLSSINFATGAGAFTLSGSGIGLAGNLINSSTSEQTIALGIELVSGGGAVEANAGNIAISGNISGTEGLTKTGSATLILAGTNSYSGGTTVANGVLEVRSPLSLPDGSALSVGSNATAIFAASSSAISPNAPAAVPEPGMLGLLAAGGLACFAKHLFRRRQRVQ
jgi:autotransporter-associated beta strand protein